MTQRLKECRPFSLHSVYVPTTSLCTWHTILTEIKGELRHIFLNSGINSAQTVSKYTATVTKSVYSSSHDIKYTSWMYARMPKLRANLWILILLLIHKPLWPHWPKIKLINYATSFVRIRSYLVTSTTATFCAVS